MIKKYLYSLFMLLLASCSTIQSQAAHKIEKTPIVYRNVYTEISSNEIQTGLSILEWSMNLEDPQVLYELAENIAIIRIDSIDGAININEFDGSKMFPSTYGDFTILKLLKGTVDASQPQRYLRMGGVLPYGQYLNGLHEQEKKKIEQNMQGKLQPIYWETKIDDDIAIKSGVEYLAYFSESKHRINAYNLVGLGWGLRELENYESFADDPTKLPEQAAIRVWDQSNKDWISIDTLLPKQ